MEELSNLCIAFAIVGAISLVSGTLYVSLWTYTGERQALRIKEKFVQSAFRQDAAWFDTHNREELPTAVANSMIHVNGAIGRQMADVFANLWAAFGCLLVAFFLNAPLAIIMLCIIPFAGIVIAILSCFIRKSSKEASRKFAAAGAIATETIAGIKTVASLGAQPWAIQNYESLCRGAQRKLVWSGFLTGLTSGMTGFLFYCTYTVAFMIGTEQVARVSNMATFIKCLFDVDDDNPDCKITGAAVMTCIYGVILSATHFGLMAPGLQAINVGRQAAVEIYATIKRQPEIDPSSEKGEKPVIGEQEGCSIELQRLFFTYPSRPNNPIFYDMNLVIKPGTSVAFVGPSGSGKSTITKLLLRFYDPTAGTISIDGIPLDSLNVAWWRSQVGFVPQEPSLFPGTLRENIRYGKPDASDSEVISAAKAACAHEFISSFSNGYDTFYSGASIQLSGGQMQRIAIARAIIRNPSVLLLDEATSALDTNSERQVQEALVNIRRSKRMTTVIIAHRLSTIMSCDEIAVIENGSVSERGTHRSLLEGGGTYAMLCESQGITLDSSPESNEDASSSRHTETTMHVDAPQAPPEQGIDDSKPQKVDDDYDDDETPKEDTNDESDLEDLAKLSRLWDHNKQEWAYLVMGTIGAIIVGALPPIEGIFTAIIVENFYLQSADDMRQANLVWSLAFLGMARASLLGNVMLGLGFSVSGNRLTRRMRTLAFQAIVRRPMGWFDVPEHSTGELTSRLEGDAEAIAKVTGWALGYRIRVFSTLVAGVVISLVWAWQIGIIAIACVPLIMAAPIVQSCCTQRKKRNQQGLSPATILERGLRDISAVQAYNLQTEIYQNYSNALKPSFAGKVREGIIAGVVFGTSQFAIFLSFAILFYVGAQLLVQVIVNFNQFFTSILAIMFGALGVAQVNADFNARKDGLAAAARIFKIVDEPHLGGTDPFCDEGDTPDVLDGAIAFESCEFRYPTRPNKPIYYPSKEHENGFSLEIASKESMAFVGKSGSGKSTALQLVLRFYDVTNGKVVLDGTDVRDLNVSWLRRNIGYVGQQPVLFNGTIKDNILLGNDGATDDDVVNAAKAANAHDFIATLHNGYDTDIGSGGSLLSGGQKQRIAIARAIAMNPPILVLDEATSALDNESERIVQAALNDLQVKQPRTTLVVAHRLLTVKECDRIAVLDKGGVKELGSHSELLRERGLYHELWMKQVGSAAATE